MCLTAEYYHRSVLNYTQSLLFPQAINLLRDQAYSGKHRHTQTTEQQQLLRATAIKNTRISTPIISLYIAVVNIYTMPLNV